MVFAPVAGLTPPVVEDGTVPKPGKESSDESVVLEFTVGVQRFRRQYSYRLGLRFRTAELLTGSLATWAFRPAMGANGPVEAIGRVRFLKGDGDEAAKLPLTPPQPSQPRVDYSVASGATDPKLLHKVDADYSDAGRAAGVKGVVVLSIVVDPQGNVVNPTVVTSLGFGLDEKAIEAVRQWKFTPGFKDGKPVAVAKIVEISFVLQKAEAQTAIDSRVLVHADLPFSHPRLRSDCSYTICHGPLRRLPTDAEDRRVADVCRYVYR